MLGSQLEEIKNKLSVVDIISGYIKLAKTGANYRGVCPFHSEKKPSFFVSPSRQIWKCFGCGKGGDIFGFVKDIESVEFVDALRILANKAGVELKRENIKLKTERQRLYEIAELTCSFFEKQLQESSIGKKAKEYLLGRGITEESIKKWRLGYSPDTWQGLSDFLVSRGYSRNEIIKAGLAVKKDLPLQAGDGSSDSYDRFRGRIIFPIFDLNSQPVGFGARVFEKSKGDVRAQQEIAKYINTPQTLLYNKSGILYGLNNAKLAVRKNNQCVVTEGYTDVILAHQAGFENTVAASGTALTQDHLNILKRYSDNLILAFDMDVAGDSATKRGIDLAQEKGFNIKIIENYSGGKDPADIILENPENWKKLLEEARLILDYYFDYAFSSFDKDTAEGKKGIANVILPVIKRLPNKIELAHWVQKLSQKLNVSENAISDELKKIKTNFIIPEQSQNTPVLNQNQNFDANSRKKLIEEKIISLVLKDPANLEIIEESHYPLFSGGNRIFIGNAKKLFSEGKMNSFAEAKTEENFKAVFADVVSNPLLSFQYEKKEQLDENFRNFLSSLALRAEIEYQEDGPEEIKLCLSELKNIDVKEKLSKISQNIKEAENFKNHQKVDSLVEEFNKLTKEL